MRIISKLLISTAIVAAVPSNAAIFINFDSVTPSAAVDEFYNGGMDSAGATGPNYGVSFTSSDWGVLTGFGETSQPFFAYSNSGSGGFDIAAGFTSQFSFTVGAFVPSTVSIYSGVGGTGSLLAQLTNITDNPGAFGPHSINFAGVAKSVIVASYLSSFGWDDLVLGIAAVPEPAQWMLMLGGFGLAGAALRRRRTMVRVAYS